jgi:hypothetical protein
MDHQPLHQLVHNLLLGNQNLGRLVDGNVDQLGAGKESNSKVKKMAVNDTIVMKQCTLLSFVLLQKCYPKI